MGKKGSNWEMGEKSVEVNLENDIKFGGVMVYEMGR